MDKMLNSLKIENFRGIPSLSIEDFGRINIFIGGNGCGKTSVLESVMLISQPTQPAMVNNLAQWREMPPPGPGNDLMLSTLFRDGNINSPPTFTFSDSAAPATARKLVISSTPDTSGVPIQFDVGSSSGPMDQTLMRAIRFTFHDFNNDVYTSRAVLGPNVIQQMVEKNYVGFGCFYIHARRATSVAEMATMLGTLSRNKEMDKFLHAVKCFHPRIKDIESSFIGHPTVLVDTDLRIKLPINVMGDGFCRTTLMVTGIFWNNADVLAVDEIDSGLHTEVMSEFWRNLITLSREHKKQVFCTTHSDEMLERTIRSFENAKGELRIFRIDRTRDGEIVATKYNYDSYARAMQAEADIR